MNDDRLRETLKQAHSGQEPPPFGPMWRRAQAEARSSAARRPLRLAVSRPMRLVLGGALAAATIAAIWLMVPGAREEVPADPLTRPVPSAAREAKPFVMPVVLASLTSWQGPTDFLLKTYTDTTGADLMSGALQVGNPESTAVPGLGKLNLNSLTITTNRRLP